MTISKTIKYWSMLLCSGLSLYSNTLQAQVQRYNANAENNYGVVYTLPKTEYELTLTVRQTQFTPGIFSPWASRLLGTDVQTKAWQSAEIVDVQLRAIGVPNTERQYLIVFDKKTIAPFVALAPGGIIYSINGKVAPQEPMQTLLPAERHPDRTLPSLPQEYSLAVTQTKRAEIVASYLYEVREHMMNIVSGEVEQMPKDGESMRLILDRLRTEEARAVRLFTGDTTTTMQRQSWRIVPEDEDMNRSIAYFSERTGLMTEQGDSALPIVFSTRIVERSPVLDAKELARREKSDGIVYNLPGVAEVSVSYNGKQLKAERLPLTQVGTIQTMSKKMLNLKDAGTTAVYFDLRSGAIERITTE